MFENTTFYENEYGLSEDALIIWQIGIYYLLIAVACVGTFGNITVLVWLRKYKRRFKHCVGESLMAMCVADTVCLICLLGYNCLATIVLISKGIPKTGKDVYCKISVFGVHSMSLFSTWCWMVLASVSFMSIFTPIFYKTTVSRKKSGYIMLAVLVLCAMNEVWVLVSTASVSDQTLEGDCVISNAVSPMTERILYTVHLSVNWFIPAVITIAMAYKVFRYRIDSAFEKASCLGDVSRANRRLRTLKSLKRYLCLASLDIFLNTPISVFRLLNICGLNYLIGYIIGDGIQLVIITGISYAMYYGQFSLNILYILAQDRPENHGQKHDGTTDKSNRTNPSSKSFHYIPAPKCSLVIRKSASATQVALTKRKESASVLLGDIAERTPSPLRESEHHL